MALNRRFAAVIFDLDSTLVNSEPSLIKAWTQWAIEYGITAEQLADWHGHTSGAIVAALVPHDVKASTARIAELEETEVGDCTALPGAEAALLAVPADRQAIATSGTRPVAAARLSAAGLPAPAIFVTATDVEHGKPAPDLFLVAAQRLGVEPADCLVCEDSAAGLTGARAAGCATLAVLTTTPRERLDADLVVPDLSHVRFDADDEGIRVVELGTGA